MDAAAVARRFPGVRAISFAPLIAAGDIPARERACAVAPRAAGSATRALELPVRARPARRSRRSPTSSRSRATRRLRPRPPLRARARARPSSARCAPACPTASEPIRLVQETGEPARLPDGARRARTRPATRHRRRVRRVPDGRAHRPGVPARRARRRHRPLRRRPGRRAPAAARAARRSPTLDDGARDRLDARGAPYGREEIGFDVMGRHWILDYAPTARPRRRPALLNWLPHPRRHRSLALIVVLGALALAPHGAPRRRAGGAHDGEPAREPDRPGALQRRARALRLRRLARPARAAAHHHRLPRPALAPLPRPARRRRPRVHRPRRRRREAHGRADRRAAGVLARRPRRDRAGADRPRGGLERRRAQPLGRDRRRRRDRDQPARCPS